MMDVEGEEGEEGVKRSLTKVSFYWTLPKFREKTRRVYLEDNDDDGHRVQEVSPEFSHSSDDSLKWKLVFYPRGRGEQKAAEKGQSPGQNVSDASPVSFSSVFLSMAQLPQKSKVLATFAVSLINENKKPVNRLTMTGHFESNRQLVGFEKFFPIAREANFLLNGNASTLYCEVYYIRAEIRREYFDALASICPVNGLNSCLEVSPEMQSFYKRSLYTDITFGSQGSEVSAHRFILFSASPKIRHAIEAKGIETNENRIEISSCFESTFTFPIIKAIIDYIYYRELTDESVTCDLLKASALLGLDGLRIYCQREIYRQMTVNNAVDMLAAVTDSNDNLVKDLIINFMLENEERIFSPAIWREKFSVHPHLLVQVTQLLDIHPKANDERKDSVIY